MFATKISHHLSIRYEAITINQIMHSLNFLRNKEGKLLNQSIGTKLKSNQWVSIENALEEQMRTELKAQENTDNRI